jgi:junctophilin
MARGNTPSAGNGAVVGSSVYTIPNSPAVQQGPFEEVVLRNRTLGQDIIPSLGQPKRTESLFINSGGGGGVGGGGGGGGGGGVSGGKGMKVSVVLYFVHDVYTRHKRGLV